MLETLLGGLLGGITRLAPEIMAFFDKKNERKHELEMIDKNIAADNARAANQLKIVDAQSATAEFTASLAALQEAVKGQSTMTGIKWIDAVNALVRPWITQVIFFMWCTVKLASLYTLAQISPNLADLAKALPLWWTPDDQAMLAAVLNFWFLGRVFDKALR